jgi:hypothetical protein
MHTILVSNGSPNDWLSEGSDKNYDHAAARMGRASSSKSTISLVKASETINSSNNNSKNQSYGSSSLFGGDWSTSGNNTLTNIPSNGRTIMLSNTASSSNVSAASSFPKNEIKANNNVGRTPPSQTKPAVAAAAAEQSKSSSIAATSTAVLASASTSMITQNQGRDSALVSSQIKTATSTTTTTTENKRKVEHVGDYYDDIPSLDGDLGNNSKADNDDISTLSNAESVREVSFLPNSPTLVI